MPKVRKQIVFHGRVQFVGFRYTSKYLADSLGLTGWVENQDDGTVLMEIQGEEKVIEKLLCKLTEGRFILIEWMDTLELPTKKESGFTVR